MAKQVTATTKQVTAQAATQAATAQAATKLPKVANQAITLLVQVNPKRGKSQARYELYRTCTTTHQFVAAGGYSADLAWDLKRGFIALAPLAN
jgi:hypothetical protein